MNQFCVFNWIRHFLIFKLQSFYMNCLKVSLLFFIFILFLVLLKYNLHGIKFTVISLQFDTFEEKYTVLQPLPQSSFWACLSSPKVLLCPLAVSSPLCPRQSIYQSGCTILHSCWQHVRVPVFHILDKVRFVSLLDFSHACVSSSILLWF